ncbi:MAG: hypothetical protein Q8O31_07785, partial [Rhodocyclaceae bacterium]|nr:hypothetical protein [Rhodocyclaceae bacterium]
CLSLHFYPIPSPALPLKGREIGTALPLKGREAATTASITHYKPHRAFFGALDFSFPAVIFHNNSGKG